MSSALATVVFSDGYRLYGVYHGTSDVMGSRLFEEFPRLIYHDEGECVCGESAERVIVHSSYGGGFWWRGLGCRRCKVFFGERMPFECDGAVEIVSGLEVPDSSMVEVSDES